MSYIILAILFLISGFFMKYSDDLFDIHNNLVLASIFAIICGFSSVIASIYDVEAAYIFIAILVGNLLALKVDGIHHIIALIVYVVVFLIHGIPEFNIVILLLCIFAAFFDEVGHELISNITRNPFFNMFFEYRFVMKITVFLLSITGFFNISIFICFLIFEFSYLGAGFLFKRLSDWQK